MPDGRTGSARGLALWLAALAPAAARGEVTVAFVSDRRMRVLNRTFRGKDAVTDVLSFPVGKRESGSPAVALPKAAVGNLHETPLLGDIVIATGVAARQAREHRHPVGTEYRVLALHGLLHLLGYDHDDPADRGRMARAEARLRKKAGLPTSLIARTSASGLPTPGSRSTTAGPRP